MRHVGRLPASSRRGAVPWAGHRTTKHLFFRDPLLYIVEDARPSANALHGVTWDAS